MSTYLLDDEDVKYLSVFEDWPQVSCCGVCVSHIQLQYPGSFVFVQNKKYLVWYMYDVYRRL